MKGVRRNFCVSIQIFVVLSYDPRLLPFVAMERDQMDTTGKTVTLIWQIMLTVGISFWDVRHFLGQVRSLTTDFGVERGIVSMPDVLIDVWEVLGLKVPTGAQPLRWLLPKCVQLAGWRHLWDNIIQRGLSALPWFPLWIERLKAIVSMMRAHSWRDALVRSLRQRGFDGLADTIEKVTFRGFAHWRWGTLKFDVVVLHTFIRSLIDTFDPSIFAGTAEPRRLRNVCAAFASAAWLDRLEFVLWYCDWLGTIQEWTGMCDCAEHQAAYIAREHVDCVKKGRRIRTAYTYAMRKLREGLRQANTWQPDNFGGDHALWEGITYSDGM